MAWELELGDEVVDIVTKVHGWLTAITWKLHGPPEMFVEFGNSSVGSVAEGQWFPYSRLRKRFTI